MRRMRLYILLIFLSILFAILSDYFVVRRRDPPIKAAGYNIELNSLLDLPVHDEGFDVKASGLIDDPEMRPFLQLTAMQARNYIRNDTIAVFMIPGVGSDARGWPFISRDWTTELQITNPELGVTVEVPVYGGSGLFCWAWLGNITFFFGTQLVIVQFVIALRCLIGKRKLVSTGFPITTPYSKIDE